MEIPDRRAEIIRLGILYNLVRDKASFDNYQGLDINNDLRTLEQAGLVLRTREGVFTFYADAEIDLREVQLRVGRTLTRKPLKTHIL